MCRGGESGALPVVRLDQGRRATRTMAAPTTRALLAARGHSLRRWGLEGAGSIALPPLAEDGKALENSSGNCEEGIPSGNPDAWVSADQGLAGGACRGSRSRVCRDEGEGSWVADLLGVNKSRSFVCFAFVSPWDLGSVGP